MFINKEIKLERKQTQEYSRVGSTYNGFAYKVSLAGQHIGSIKRIRVGDEYSTQSKWQWWASQNRKGNPMFAKWDNPCNAIKLRDIDKWLDRECQRVLKGDLEGKESANADSDSGGLGAPEALTTDYNAALIIERQNIGTKTNGFRVSVFVNGEHFESIGENDADGGADLARRAAAFFENRTAETIAAHIDNVRNLRIGRVYDSAAMPVSSGYGLHHFTPEVSERIARLAALKKCGVDALITAALDALESPEYGDPDVSERKHRTEWFAARQPVNNHADAISADQLDLHHLMPEAQQAAGYDVPRAYLDVTECGIVRCMRKHHDGVVRVFSKTQTAAGGLERSKTDMRDWLHDVEQDIFAAYFQAHGDTDPEGLWDKVQQSYRKESGAHAG